MTFDPNKTIVARVKRRIVPNWRSRVRDWSTIMLALSAAVATTWATFPAEWLKFLPVEWVAKGVGMLSAIGLVSKFVIQGPLPPEEKQ